MSRLQQPGRPTAPVWGGAVALALAALLIWWATPRWLADAARAEAALRQQARIAAMAPPPAAQRPAPDQQLVQALPPAADLPRRISALVQLAGQHGLRLDSLRQQPARPLGQGAAALEAEQVTLRLAGQGPYEAWRRLVAETLQQDDALVLSELRLARPTPDDRSLEASLHWVLLQRPATVPAAAGMAP